MTDTSLLFSVENHVARITLNRPQAANSLNLDLAKSLFDAAVTCDEDSDIRAVVLTSTGKMFCAGGDLKSFWKHEQDLGRHLEEVAAPPSRAMTC